MPDSRWLGPVDYDIDAALALMINKSNWRAGHGNFSSPDFSGDLYKAHIMGAHFWWRHCGGGQ